MSTALVWFRQDLRLADNPALALAAQRGAVLPVYIWATDEEGAWPPGAASRWWLHQSLTSLDASLRRVGSRLIVRQGLTLETLQDLLGTTGADAVFWNRRYEPAAIARDTRVKKALTDQGIHAESCNGSLLFEPWTLATQQKRPYQVYTPFYKAALAGAKPAAPLPAPGRLTGPKRWPESLPLAELGLEPRIDWAGGLRVAWQPGEAEARGRLAVFLETAVHRYDEDRDRPDREGVSRLSPHLHFGEISPREVYHALQQVPMQRWEKGREVFLKEVIWREFAHHLLYHFPHTTDAPLREDFARFPWLSDNAGLRAWQRGLTGYPLVDAGMRQLWATGWMHNRVRMVVASFLVKHLLLPWQCGAKWFWGTLVDADLANNTLGWQWSAGCGADAAPYFRIFNPAAQGEKFDPAGAYVKRWVPELARVPPKFVHQPAQASAGQLADWGVTLGTTYPAPIVEHATARTRALAALATISKDAE